MPDAAIECGDAKVARLLAFVAARVEEDRLGAHMTAPVDEAALERCDIVQQVLLDMARDTCSPIEPCPLPQRCLRALDEYAFMHKTHRHFDPEWMAWRLLP
ncbi:hypothetical protein [Nocardioides sp. zg-1230]|uniref:hypothetical protein n=1 Tax=Nocardioides sp. zg-1230 TaxID=2736601 RepID=UPI0015563CCF|nr:hypothetical protein [Nocardioides sp. zg-1230]NPC43353.1 hypothetical protein [Nocardioides sp. zg-1230]NPC44743.1 hypothetical protein [Nocardioides sp. zg-1230]